MPELNVKPKDLLAMLHRQGFRCAYTDDPLTPETVGADHKTPVSRGGGHSLDNIALVTRQVNAAKGTMTVEDFVDLCRKVARQFGEAVAVAPAVDPEVLSGTADPIEILTKLGYVGAADEFRETKAKLSRYEKYSRKHGKTALSFEEYTKSRQAQIALLQKQIANLQVKRSTLRRLTGRTAE